MTEQTLTLTAFLLARIAEDEVVARRAQAEAPGPWGDVRGSVYDAARECIAGYAGESAASHIARYDPARVLAECEAKRRIVSDAQALNRHGRHSHLLTSVLELLTLPYADHPDYRDEWRP